MTDSRRAVLRGSVVLSAGLAAQKAVDLLLEIFLVSEWGASGVRDAYLAASTVLIAGAVAELSVLPSAIRRGQVDIAASRDFVTGTVVLTAFVAFVVGLVSVLTWVPTGKYAAGEYVLAVGGFACVAVGAALLSGLAGERVSAGHYGLAALRLTAISSGMLGGALLWSPSIAGPAVGGAITTVLLAAVAGRSLSFPRVRLAMLAIALLPFLVNAYPVVARVLVERSVLSLIEDGTLARLDIAEKVTSIIAWSAAATAGIVAMSRGYRSRMHPALITAVITLPPMLLVLLFPGEVVRILFEREEFTRADTEAVVPLARILALSIPGQAALPILTAYVEGRYLTLAAGVGATLVAVHIATCVAVLSGRVPIAAVPWSYLIGILALLVVLSRAQQTGRLSAH